MYLSIISPPGAAKGSIPMGRKGEREREAVPVLQANYRNYRVHLKI